MPNLPLTGRYHFNKLLTCNSDVLMGGGPGAAPPSFLLSDAWKAKDTTYGFIDIHSALPEKPIRNEEAQQIASTPRFSYCGGLSTRTTPIKASDMREVCEVIGRLYIYVTGVAP